VPDCWTTAILNFAGNAVRYLSLKFYRPGVVDTGHQFMTGVKDTGGKFIAGVVDTGDKLHVYYRH